MILSKRDDGDYVYNLDLLTLVRCDEKQLLFI